MNPNSPLEALMARDLAGPAPDAGPLVAALRARYGDALDAVVMYGSCRRNDDAGDGLVDLLAVVAGYRRAHRSRLSAIANRLLPPNVYYLEAPAANGRAGRLRCKYILVSRDQFARRCNGGLDGYFWARFTQPCRLVWSASEAATSALAAARAAAARAFSVRAATLGNGSFTPTEFWVRAIRASYGCELRPEPPDAARALVARDAEFWTALSTRLAGAVPGLGSGPHGIIQVRSGRVRGLAGRAGWASRKVWSKLLNLARLVKAAGTFANGLDYLVWKVERHSGVRVETTERMRRHPRLAAWGLAFRLWRQGAFR